MLLIKICLEIKSNAFFPSKITLIREIIPNYDSNYLRAIAFEIQLSAIRTVIFVLNKLLIDKIYSM